MGQVWVLPHIARTKPLDCIITITILGVLSENGMWNHTTMKVIPSIIPHSKANELWHSKPCYIYYFAELAWFDHLFKVSKVTNHSVCLAFSHQWSEYQIKKTWICAFDSTVKHYCIIHTSCYKRKKARWFVLVQFVDFSEFMHFCSRV